MPPSSGSMSAPDTHVMVVGYDNDPNSTNLFTGIVQAVRQAGSNVIDIGYCSAASLQHSIRQFKATGGIIVTSATVSKSLSGEIGFDVFDRHGQSISVPWQKYGIRVRLRRTDDHKTESVAGSKPEQFARDLRKQSDFDSHPAPNAPMATSEQLGELILPDTSNAAAIPSGRRRHSGQLQTQSMEAIYRNRMLKWWGQSNAKNTIRLYCQNEIVIGRIEWLAAASSARIEIHEERAPVEQINSGGLNQPVTIEISQDDRLFKVWSRTGRLIENPELVEWLNQRLPRTLRHVTAHAAAPFPMIRLLDLAGPDSGESHETTIDAVAILGLLLGLNDDGRHPLPA
ncbi:MAG: hypothetical protein ABJZ55_11660 [Fuerstiella sp.]